MNGDAFRSFIAIPSVPSLRKRLETLQDDLKKLDLDVKWVLPEQIHLTLKFLGQTRFSILEELKACLDEIAQRTSASSFWVDRFGAFPDLRRPRVLWVGSGETPPGLQKLAQSIEDDVTRFGFEKENRSFKTHLTLGRFRSPKHGDRLERWVKEYPLSWREEFPCERVILFQSTLTPTGPIYTPLYEVSLKKI